jgi:ubiquinone/menaquinone biosynthesis C-methylase UbiE
MDYDQTTMPEVYDRARTPPAGVLDMWMDRIAVALAGRDIADIIDLGCGTGRFTGALANRFSARVIGIDPSQKMLAQATAKELLDGVTFVHGAGERIPCPDDSADLVFSSMAFHHFADRRAVASECRRVLRKDGVVCVRNSLREHGTPYTAYFPNFAASLASLPSANDIVSAFTSSGFQLASHDVVQHKMAENLRDLAEKAKLRGDTTLVKLSEADFAQGLARLNAAAQTQDQPVMLGVSLFVFTKPAC